MATSPNYGWLEPDNTDLVKNGALAIRTLGNAIDTTMATMTPKSIVDAKGDLIAATANDTPARLAVGNNGETLVADSSTSTGLRYNANFAAGKNAIINGDFRVWQRGTTFTSPATNTYTADRWVTNQDGNGTVTVSQQSFTPGTAPVAGYEAPFFLRQAVTAAGTTSFFQMQQKIEDVRTFANQTVTFSFWAKADSSRTGLVYWEQNFGSGGSATVQSTVFPAPALTTSWQRFTYTFTLPSISGKTIGTGSCLIFYIRNGGTASGANLDIWGAQLEAGSVATAFQTATGTIQGELAACQRYYFRITAGADNYVPLTHIGGAISTTATTNTLQLPVTLRAAATSIEYANLWVYGGGTSGFGFLSVSNLALIRSSTSMLELTTTVAGATTGAFYRIQPNGTAGYIGVVAEL